MPKPAEDDDEEDEEEEKAHNNHNKDTTKSNGNNDKEEKSKQPQQPGASWEENNPKTAKSEEKTKNPKKMMDIVDHENAVLALSSGDNDTARGEDDEVFEHEFSRRKNPVVQMLTPSTKQRDHQEDLDPADMAFPTDLERNNYSQPGAFPQQGINSLINSNNNNADHTNTENTEREDEENQLNSEAIATAAALLGANAGTQNGQSNDLLFSAVLAPNSSNLHLPRAQPVNSVVSPNVGPQTVSEDADSQQEQRDGESHHHHQREAAPMASAEPLDELLLRRKKMTRRVIVYLAMGALLLTGVTVALTMVLDGSTNAQSDFNRPRSSNGETDDDVEAAIQDVNSAFDSSLVDSLDFGGFHAVEFGFATQGCEDMEWSELELECTGSDEAKTTVFVVDISDNAVVCQREKGERNSVTCKPDEMNEMSSFSATILVGCGSNERYGVAVQATMDVATAENCAIQLSSAPYGALGGSKKTVRGESFQWIGVGRFCGTNPYQLLADHTCIQGGHLHLPGDAPDICSRQNQLCTAEQSFCFSRGPCTTTKTCTTNDAATCVGGDACDTVVNVVEVADPMVREDCVYSKDLAVNQSTFSFDRGAMWIEVDKIYHYYDDVIPTAIQSKGG